MCELFGLSSPVKLRVNELLHEFFSHSSRHPDGWGIAVFSGSWPSVEKQPLKARSSLYLKSRLRAFSEVSSMIAHIRRATKGSVEYENTHPFVRTDASGRTWTLAHNGTVFESALLDPLYYEQEGQTDSERILLYIIRKMNELISEGSSENGPSAKERFRVLDRVLCDITHGNKVNLLLYDGELMYVHTNYQGSLHQRTEGAGRIFSTQPLDLKAWEPVPLNTLHAFQNGRLLLSGTDHGNQFFDDESKMRHLYLDYAGL